MKWYNEESDYNKFYDLINEGHSWSDRKRKELLWDDDELQT